MAASVCTLSLHLYCWLQRKIVKISLALCELLLLHLNRFVQIDSPRLQSMQSGCSRTPTSRSAHHPTSYTQLCDSFDSFYRIIGTLE
ncbi:hypothetical protein TRIUR3_09399 [Triticum urartu]|uniref:Uncharacterized protein n=1 Tax=Triticum urartu TaxID=4572 RepID=M7ZR46_TRIUA|nr:hypothetical protein TRIUR3_09399 [Triticum urartu]